MLHALVAENCNNPGTGTFLLAGAVTGCVTFTTRFASGVPCFYLATDGSGVYEAGIGTFTTGSPATLSRDTVTENSSNTTAKINFPGAIQVINFLASDKVLYLDSTGSAHVHGPLIAHSTLEVDGNVLLGANALTISAKDASNVTQTIFVPLDATNNTKLYIGGGLSTPAGKFQVLTIAGVQLFGVDYSGNATVAGALAAATSVKAGGVDSGGANFRAIGGNYGAMLRNDGSGVYLLQTASGGQTGSFNATRPFSWNLSTGAVTIDGTGAGTTMGGALHVSGAANVDGAVVIPNTVSYSGKDTGGTVHPLMVLDGSNLLTMWIPLSQRFRVVNTLFSAELFSVDNSGNTVVAGQFQVAGVTTTAGLHSTSALAVDGASTLTGNVGCAGTLSTFGATTLTESGWEYAGFGEGSLSPTARSYGVIVGGGNVGCLAFLFDAYSDFRLKSDIKAITPDMGRSFVLGTKPSTFIKGGFFEAGFVAQEMIRAGYQHMISAHPYPDLPELNEGGLLSKKDIALTMAYDQAIAYLTAALQGVFARVDALEMKP